MIVLQGDQETRIKALEEAICPRVAARLTALERLTAGMKLTEARDAELRKQWELPRSWNVMSECQNRVQDRSGVVRIEPRHARLERQQRYKKVRQIALEVLGDHHSYKGSYGDIEIIVRRK